MCCVRKGRFRRFNDTAAITEFVVLSQDQRGVTIIIIAHIILTHVPLTIDCFLYFS